MKRTIDYLVDLIQIDTQNHKENETELVEYLIAFCKNHDVNYKLYSKKESRKNIIITVGNTTDQDLIVLGHTDVVKANKEDGWRCPPFSGEILEGYLYGRGALDMKYMIASCLSILEKLNKIETELKRGIHFVFSADEENGSEFGMKHLMTYKEVRQLLSNKIAINEGGGFSFTYRDKMYYLYETGQKSVGRLKISVKTSAYYNPYFPTLEHEMTLVKAIRAIEEIKLNGSLPKTTLKLLKALAGNHIKDEELLDELSNNMNQESFLLIKAMSESYITATIIKGGSRQRELPSTIKAEAIFDMRILPNISKDALLKAIHESVKGLDVDIELLSFSQGFESDLEHPIVANFEKALKRKDNRILGLLPFITPGSNDGKFLKNIDSTVFGFAPLCPEDAFVEVMKGIHAVNERIKVESIDFNKVVMEEVIVDYLKGDDYVDQ